MKRVKRKSIAILAAAALMLLLGGLLLQPELRVRRFIAAHGNELETRMVEGQGIPDRRMGIRYFNHWKGNGEHDMTEFILFIRGDTYYGCYYSPDDVPLAFQNTDAELSRGGEDTWNWQADGDNHGATQRIRDHWYYFEASL